ncbi:MAG: HAMP domain-containing protein [Opitutaceae bacterium]|nr:HAMP domain-containing protein [Opitutaceae bacterium]
MRRFWMRSLTSQLIGLMLFALILSQVAFFLIYRSERVRSLRDIRRDEFLARAAAVTRLVKTADPALYPTILRASSTSLARYWISSNAPGDTMTWQTEAKEHLLHAVPVEEDKGEPGSSSVAETRGTNPRFIDFDLAQVPTATWEHLPSEAWSTDRPAQLIELKSWNGFGLAVQIRPGLWLNLAYAKPEIGAQPPVHYYVFLGLTALVLSLVSVLVARRVARPLQRLAETAERIGRGEDAGPVPEEGTDDIRRTAAAFNRMQMRIRRFVEDRTRMMAAISHDLRTPITTMRLRVEFIEDTEAREKLIATLDEMKAMTESALAFAREEATLEPTRTVDMVALVESLCQDLADIGWSVTFVDGERVTWRLRPDAVRRALRNLIENAVRYGDRAQVRLVTTPEGLDVVVEDEGPGIPREQQERVFAPFVRLETSRNRTTGGAGLGLAIARTIARSHGGEIIVVNRQEGGLCAILRLPRGEPAVALRKGD